MSRMIERLNYFAQRPDLCSIFIGAKLEEAAEHIRKMEELLRVALLVVNPVTNADWHKQTREIIK